MVENIFKENKEQWKNYWLGETLAVLCHGIWKVWGFKMHRFVDIHA